MSFSLRLLLPLTLLMATTSSFAQPPEPSAPEVQPRSVRIRHAYDNGDNRAVEKIARQALVEGKDSSAWYYGNFVHDYNQWLGLVALRENRLEEARHYLIMAGKSPGSPQLDSFGPDMILAQKLLKRGPREREAVLLYLDLVADFWAYTPPDRLAKIEKKHPGATARFQKSDAENRQQIELWKQQIREGKNPTLNNSDYPD